MASSPPLNLETLNEMYEGNQALVDTTLRLFGTDLQKDFENLSAAVAQNDAPQVHLLSHRIKGSAGIVGGVHLATISAAVEVAAKASDWSAIRREMSRLTEAVAEIARFLSERRA